MKTGKKKKSRKSGAGKAGQRLLRRNKLFYLGLEHHKAGRLHDAALFYRQALEITPGDEELLFNLGIVCHCLEDPEEAVQHYAAALQLAPDNILILKKMGAALQELGKKEEAAGAYRRLIALSPAASEAHHHLGIINYQLGQLDQAASSFEKCLELDNSHPHASYNLGLVRYDQVRLDDAVSCFRHSLEIDPDNGNTLYNLGTILRELHMSEEAAGFLRAALEINPLDADILFNLGIVCKDIGELDEAVRFFKLALEVDPENGAVCSALGLIHHLRDEIDEAIKAYSMAIAIGDSMEGNNHILAALMGKAAHSVPKQYVENLFDGYALNFEKSLTSMKYEIPLRLKQALLNLPAKPKRYEKALDLGCGTGLSGLQFRPIVDRLTGVDLSRKMLEKAATKEIYDSLSQGDLIEFLNNGEERFDLLLLTDVIIYFGNLVPLFSALHDATRTGDLVLFSTEVCDAEKEYTLRQSGRFAHSPDYIAKLAEEYSFAIEFLEPAGIREEKGVWTMGEMYILCRV